MMRWLLLALLLLMPGARAETPEQLIDKLTEIDCPSPGVHSYIPYHDFWAVVPDSDSHDFYEDDGKGIKHDCVPEAMRELVRLGPAALPALLKHVDDARPTRLSVGTTIPPDVIMLGGQGFTAEYDPRTIVYHNAYPSSFMECTIFAKECGETLWFREPYTVRVGDICYTLIGQIVGRALTAARYQMTGWLYVNSPVQRPELAMRVRADWSGVGADGLKASLLGDLREDNRHTARLQPKQGRNAEAEIKREALSYVGLHARALRRLRFYFPDAYAALSGHDLEKRIIFEQEERAQWNLRPRR